VANVFHLIQVLKGHDNQVRYLTELRDGSLASCSYDRTIKIWSLTDGNYSCTQTLEGHQHHVRKIIQLKDGSLASCSYDKTIKIWSLKNGFYYCSQTIKDHSVNDFISIIQLRDGTLASCSRDACTKPFGNTHSIKIWSLKDGLYCCSQVLQNHTQMVTDIAQLNDDSLATCSADYSIKIWESELTKIKIPDTEDNEVICV
jgi:WD40 repeat protein